MATRTTFIWYIDRVDYVEAMTNEELWILFRQVLLHVAELEEVELPPELRIIRAKIKKQLDDDKYKWEDKIEKRSEAGSNHVWNQYTRQREKRKEHKQAKKPSMEQMEQNGTNGTHLIMYNNNILSSSKKEEKNRRKEEMLEAFRKDERLTPYMNEEDVVRWWEYKEWRKEPYKDAKSFIKTLIGVKNDIASYWGMPKSDRNRRNRFSYMVDRIIEGNWSWLERYDSFEQKYQNSKDDLYPNPKQNE